MKQSQESLKKWKSDEVSIVGKSIPRDNALAKATGQAKYASDIVLPNMLHAALIRSTIAAGSIREIYDRIDQPGVHYVLTYKNCPIISGQPPVTKKFLEYPDKILLDDQVRFYGEIIGAVVAETPTLAKFAANSIQVDYQTTAAILDTEEVVTNQGHVIQPDRLMGIGEDDVYFGELSDMANGCLLYQRGNLEETISQSSFSCEQFYSTETQHHNALEPHGCVVKWSGNKLIMWDSNQGIHWIRRELAMALGIKEENVEVINTYTGGGFGAKKGLKTYHVITAILAKELARPIRLFMDREEEFIASQHRAKTKHFFRGGVTSEGKLAFLHHRVIGQGGPDDKFTSFVANAPVTRKLYPCDHLTTEIYRVRCNLQNPVPMRGPVIAENTFAFEQFIDELAHRANLDPLEFRLRNYAEIDPENKLPFSSKGLRDCYFKGSQCFRWSWQHPQNKSIQEKMRGQGMSSIIFHGCHGENSEAHVLIKTNGEVEVILGISEFGTGATTIFAQIAAEELGIDFDKIKVTYGNSSKTPYSIDASYGSRTTAIVGHAVRNAAFDAKKKFAVSDKAGNENILGIGFNSERQKKSEVSTFGVHFVEVEVDTKTGQVKVIRAVCAYDIGLWINPLLVTSQIQGGFIQGMGMALYEEGVIDKNIGLMLNSSMHQYRIPTAVDTPISIECIEVNKEDSSNNIGAKGIGEPPLVGTGAAIANAIYNAIGIRLRSYPITPDKILREIHAAI